jgi:hypothetical protein
MQTFFDNNREKQRYLEKIELVFLFKVGVYTYHHGNVQNPTYIWKIDENATDDEINNNHYNIRTKLKGELEVFHTRAMKKEFLEISEMYLGKLEKARTRNLLKYLLNDNSAAESSDMQEVDNRIQLLVEVGDPDIITDFRHINEGRIAKFDTFWKYAKLYLENAAESSILAVDERRHDPIQHLSHAISTRDFRNQVIKLCPPDIDIPSLQWIRYQFWPRNPTHKSSMLFTGILPAKFMVQSRQLRIQHPDTHYASAIFRYLKEMAILLKEDSLLIFMDDKHRCKVGEPGFPVAAVERGKQVLVSLKTKFTIADHDFTKCGIIPSVTMLCDIPNNIDESFYRGQVYVGLKDPIFQPSDPLRHITELYDILIKTELDRPYLFLYTDGGPDHRVTFMRVQIALIVLFIGLDLDLLVVARTPPGHSWKNPVERIMSILNQGLQCIGLMRSEMDEEFEEILNKCNSMAEIRNQVEKEPQLKDKLIKSLQTTIQLMENIFQ